MLTGKYRIMIMTASVGCGHDRVAKVIEKQLLDKHENIEIKTIDFIDIFPPAMGQFIKSAYLKMIDKAPNWYNLLYKLTAKSGQKNKVSSIFTYKYKKKICALIKAFNPHIVLFTNPFPLILVSQLKRKNKINTYTASIITDYTAHSVWLDPTINSYFVGSNVLRREMTDRGISALKIHVTGIPVDKKFNMPVNREEKMAELGLDVNLPTILIMGGGLGLGPIEDILETTDQINRPLQLIVVAGKNEFLKHELENRIYNQKHNVKVLGFCNNIHELMECSHLLISKAGGLTMTEAAVKKLPVLVFDPIPGQEMKNAQYFSNIGAAMYLKNLEEIKNAIDELLYKRPEKRHKMVGCCSMICKPYAAEEVSDFILEEINNIIYEKTTLI